MDGVATCVLLAAAEAADTGTLTSNATDTTAPGPDTAEAGTENVTSGTAQK